MLRSQWDVQYHQRVLETGPIGYWQLNEQQGTVAYDMVTAHGLAASRNGTHVAVTLGQPGIGDGNPSPLYDGAASYSNIYSTSLATSPDFFDGFTRADGPLGNAPTGEAWQLTGAGWLLAKIDTNRFTGDAVPTSSNNIYAWVTLANQPTELCGHFSYVAGPGAVAGGVIALISSSDASVTLQHMVHLYVSYANAAITLWEPGAPNQPPASGTYTATFVPPLATDGTPLFVRLVIRGTDATVYLPDGQVLNVSDPRIPALAGRVNVWQLGYDQNSLFVPRWDDVRARNSQATQGFNGFEGTMLMWSKVADATVWTDGSYRYLCNVAANGNNFARIYKDSTNNSLTYFYKAGGVNKFVVLGSQSFTNFAQLGLTWSAENDQVKAYKNGQQVGATQTGLGIWDAVPTVALIGSASTVPAFPWYGWHQHYGLVNRALSAAAMADLARLS